MAAVLGIRETDRPPLERLAEVLRPRALLVVLDNCEHLVRSCAELADGLLRACPHLQILATSREALGVGGEVIRRAPSLPFPASTGSAPDASRQTEQTEAVQLFVERARAASGFRLTEQNSAAVVAVCRQLEGMPLAIELAAGRTRMLTPRRSQAGWVIRSATAALTGTCWTRAVDEARESEWTKHIGYCLSRQSRWCQYTFLLPRPDPRLPCGPRLEQHR